MRVRTTLASFFALIVTGCAADQTRINPPPLPARFLHGDAVSHADWPGLDWYRGFTSAELDHLVAAATRANLDLEASRARVIQADARARQAGASLLPSLDAIGNGTYYAGHSSQGGGHEFDSTAMFSTSYEFDFWGKNRAAIQSAQYLSAASRAERDTVALTTLAGIADGYFRSLAVRARLRIAETNRDTSKQLLDVVRARFDAGTAGPVELANQKSAYDTAQITLADLQQLEVESISALALLLGRLPEDLQISGDGLNDIQEPSFGLGLPSALLQRRPDVYFAEANLRAAHADVRSARAALFPNVSLTAAAGLANPALPATVLAIPGTGPSFALGGNLTQPIFDHGRLKALRDEAVAKETELLTAYQSSIIAAFTDVENALSALAHLDQVRAAQAENLVESGRAFAGAKARYEAGSGDFLTLLESQRSLYIARDQFVQYRLARLQALVSLSKALGGGWTVPTATGGRAAVEAHR